MLSHPRTRVPQIFAEALRLPESAREEFLYRRCGEDAELRREAESLLARHKEIGGFLEPPSADRTLPDSVISSLLHCAVRAGLCDSGAAPPADSLLRAGERLGPFAARRFLARGGTSEVWEATLCGHEGLVALKVQRAAGSLEDLRRFRREVGVAADIEHPHLVRVRSHGEDRRRSLLYYAMDLVRGTSLADLLRVFVLLGSPADAETRRHLVTRFLEVAEALAALHEHGLVHRDVKPGNIVLESDDESLPWTRRAVLVDLGLVRPVATDSNHSMVWATPCYAAPELLLGLGVDGRSDVYSLGLTMYDVLSGRSPERRATSGVREPLARLVPGIEPDLVSIVDLATTGARDARYTAAALAADLRQLLAGRRVRRFHGLRGVGAWLRRHPERGISLIGKSVRVALVLAVLVFLSARTIDVLAAAASARRAWANGRLEEVIPAASGVPSLLRGALLPDLSRHLPRAGASHAADDPLAAVVAAASGDGREAACLLAARFLERDGLSRHPRMARFVLNALDAEPSHDAAGTSPVLRLLARLFFERPDHTAEDSEASGAFRERFVALLREAAATERHLLALTALSGCGGRDDLAEILSRLERSSRSGCEQGAEEIRLGLLAMGAITRREHRGGRLATWRGLDLSTSISRAAGVVARSGENGPGPEGRLAGALEDFCVAVVFACEAGSIPAPDFGSVHLGQHPRLRAALRGQDLLGHLRRGENVLAETAGPNLRGLETSGDFARFGDLAGCFASADLERELEVVVRAAALRGRLDVDWCMGLYGIGLGNAREERRGVRSAWEPDADSRLGAPLGAVPAELEQLTCATAKLACEQTVAHWDFSYAPPTVQGGGGQPSLRRVTIDPDELEPDRRFARLAVPGVSEVRLPFSVRPLREEFLRIDMAMQKGQRSLLPYCGEVLLDLLLDGARVVEGLRLQGGGSERILLPLCPAVEARDHVLELRLNGASNTTLRLYSVTLSFR